MMMIGYMRQKYMSAYSLMSCCAAIKVLLMISSKTGPIEPLKLPKCLSVRKYMKSPSLRHFPLRSLSRVSSSGSSIKSRHSVATIVTVDSFMKSPTTSLETKEKINISDMTDDANKENEKIEEEIKLSSLNEENDNIEKENDDIKKEQNDNINKKEEEEKKDDGSVSSKAASITFIPSIPEDKLQNRHSNPDFNFPKSESMRTPRIFTKHNRGASDTLEYMTRKMWMGGNMTEYMSDNNGAKISLQTLKQVAIKEEIEETFEEEKKDIQIKKAQSFKKIETEVNNQCKRKSIDSMKGGVNSVPTPPDSPSSFISMLSVEGGPGKMISTPFEDAYSNQDSKQMFSKDFFCNPAFGGSFVSRGDNNNQATLNHMKSINSRYKLQNLNDIKEDKHEVDSLDLDIEQEKVDLIIDAEVAGTKIALQRLPNLSFSKSIISRDDSEICLSSFNERVPIKRIESVYRRTKFPFNNPSIGTSGSNMNMNENSLRNADSIPSAILGNLDEDMVIDNAPALGAVEYGFIKDQQLVNPMFQRNFVEVDREDMFPCDDSVLDLSSFKYRNPLRQMVKVKSYKMCVKKLEGQDAGAYENPLRMSSFRSHDSELDTGSIRVRNPMKRIASFQEDVDNQDPQDHDNLSMVEEEFATTFIEQTEDENLKNAMMDRFLAQGLISEFEAEANMKDSSVVAEEDHMGSDVESHKKITHLSEAALANQADINVMNYVKERFLADCVTNELEKHPDILEMARLQHLGKRVLRRS